MPERGKRFDTHRLTRVQLGLIAIVAALAAALAAYLGEQATKGNADKVPKPPLQKNDT